jgi:hypothetical protein
MSLACRVMLEGGEQDENCFRLTPSLIGIW